ncbi:DUF3890 domain-containing protein [Borrelia hispanica]|uniref:DUF3890 domain-containing protein n=1 Tax=Borrelia hispanica TaxID=40835 RepID=UPI000462FCFC|nr:DUF3890 domain-containing protein [Borrelia hispanica]
MSSDVESEGLRDIYLKIKSLLNVTEDNLSFDEFQQQANLLEMIIKTKGISLNSLNESQASLLLYYYLGCKLQRCGVIHDIDLGRIKKEKLGELEIDYHPTSDNTTCINNDYCIAFEALLKEVKLEQTKPFAIGVV